MDKLDLGDIVKVKINIAKIIGVCSVRESNKYTYMLRFMNGALVYLDGKDVELIKKGN